MTWDVASRGAAFSWFADGDGSAPAPPPPPPPPPPPAPAAQLNWSILARGVGRITLPGGVTSSAPAPPGGRTVTLRLVDKADSGAALPSLTGLKWAFYDTTDPSAWTTGPVDKGSGESTDGSGDLVVNLPNTTLTAGQIGWLIVTNSDGTVTQSPPCRSFCGPVTVA